jgi:hypothetical protein
MKLVEREYNFLELVNCGLIVVGFWAAGRVHHVWLLSAFMFVVFLLCNYKVVSRDDASANPLAAKARKRLYHSVSFWWLVVLGAYFVYVFVNTGWVFWFLLFSGVLGGGIAALLRRNHGSSTTA